MYGCESWTIKKAEHLRIGASELWCWRRLESPLDSKKIKTVNTKGNQSWIFTERTDAIAKTPLLWPRDVKNRTILKSKMYFFSYFERKKDHHPLPQKNEESTFLNWEKEQVLEIVVCMGSLECCSPWDCKQSDMTWQLNNNNRGHLSPQQNYWVGQKVHSGFL